jgi:hypothetical protein
MGGRSGGFGHACGGANCMQQQQQQQLQHRHDVPGPSNMRITVLLGLLHRIQMNTLDQDVPMLLPVLLSYSAQFEQASYPTKLVLRCLSVI